MYEETNNLINPEELSLDQYVKMGIEFDVKILEAMILNEDIVRFQFFVVSIRKLSDGVELTLDGVGIPLENIELNSTIFYRESVHKMTMRPYFRDFTDTNLIASNFNYRMLSSIKFDSLYKCIAYVIILKSHRARLCNAILMDIKARGTDGIYDELRKLMDLVQGSFYDSHKRRHLPVIRDGRTVKKPLRQLRVN